jgi:hypothetical protein
MLDKYCCFVYVLPLMSSLVKKKKGNRLYYYLVESARVDGKPRIVHQAYLGTAEKLAELVQQNTAPIPLSATLRNFGLPGALWLAAKQSGVWPLLESVWSAPRSGPGPAHYLLLAAIHRICAPGPKTEVSDWYERTILASQWGFSAERFTSQAFWDAFEQILPETSETLAPAEDPLDQAQLRLLGLWKEKQLVGRRLLAYDTTNFYTYIASSNTRAIQIALEVGMPLKIAAKVDRVDREYYECKIKPLLVNPDVEYVGEIAEHQKVEFLGNAYAHLFPIDWPEPFGLTMIEAMACGTPTIAFNCGSVPELITHGVSGLIVNNLLEAVSAVAEASALSRAACRQEFETRFTASRMAQDYVRLYEAMLSTKSLSTETREIDSLLAL